MWIVIVSRGSSLGKSVAMMDGVMPDRIVEVHLAVAMSREDNAVITEIGTAATTATAGAVALWSSTIVRSSTGWL